MFTNEAVNKTTAIEYRTKEADNVLPSKILYKAKWLLSRQFLSTKINPNKKKTLRLQAM